MKQTDIDTLTDDRAAYMTLVQDIVENRRLAWEIVSAWLRKHNYLLIEDTTARPIDPEARR